MGKYIIRSRTLHSHS